jgi:hypothetical protein
VGVPTAREAGVKSTGPETKSTRGVNSKQALNYDFPYMHLPENILAPGVKNKKGESVDNLSFFEAEMKKKGKTHYIQYMR